MWSTWYRSIYKWWVYCYCLIAFFCYRYVSYHSKCPNFFKINLKAICEFQYNWIRLNCLFTGVVTVKAHLFVYVMYKLGISIVKVLELVALDIIDYFVVDKWKPDGYTGKKVIEIGCWFGMVLEPRKSKLSKQRRVKTSKDCFFLVNKYN